MDRQDGQDRCDPSKTTDVPDAVCSHVPSTPQRHSGRHILFVYSTLNQLGGIETLIVRLARRLHFLGHRVTLLLQHRSDKDNQDPGLLAEVRQYARVLFVRGWFRAAPGSLRDFDFQNVDFIHAFESNSLLLATVIQQSSAPGARIVTGVYHTREYGTFCSPKRYQMLLVEDVFRSMPAQNLFFMNDANILEHNRSIGRNFGDSPIIPLAIDTARFASTMRHPDRHRIVSVGRVTDFKTYNFTMLDVVRALRAGGRPVEYHIYGDGELLPKLKQRVCELRLEECVFLHGALPYERFGAVMERAGVFVGMGTALIEAAACGVPALTAIESAKEPVTYGYLHETSGYHLGEYIEGETEYRLSDKIEELLALSPAEYDAACRRSRERAAEFSIEEVTDRLVECLEASAPFEYKITGWMRLRDEIDLWTWRVLRALGRPDPYQSRYPRKV